MIVQFGLSFEVYAYYGVLSGLNLGNDASSLYDGRARPWSAQLAQLYPRDAKRAETLQVWPLIVARPLRSEAHLGSVDRAFGPALAARLSVHAEAMHAEWAWSLPARRDRAERLAASLGPDLEVARAALWGRTRRAAPTALVLNAPIPGHGRAASMHGRQVIAACFDDPDDDLFCQILHEDTHAVSDLEVRARWPDDTSSTARSTVRGTPGFARHRELEAHALTTTRDALERALPERLEAYDAWCASRRNFPRPGPR